MENWLERTELLLGKEKLEALKRSHVLVAGLGGVGAYLAESLCRAGLGELTLADSDIVKPSNRNRQLIALSSTEGRLKAEAMAERLRDINSEIHLHIITQYLKDDVLKDVVCRPYDYVADALDTLSPKLFLLIHSVNYGHKIISSMGACSKIHPERIMVADISETNTCPLALLLRKRLKKHGISKGIKAVFSYEAVMEGSRKYVNDELNKKTIVGTISYMPAIFGLFMASVIIRDLTGTLPVPY